MFSCFRQKKMAPRKGKKEVKEEVQVSLGPQVRFLFFIYILLHELTTIHGKTCFESQTFGYILNHYIFLLCCDFPPPSGSFFSPLLFLYFILSASFLTPPPFLLKKFRTQWSKSLKFFSHLCLRLRLRELFPFFAMFVAMWIDFM